jgi:ABC-type transporter Mla subunit MlaD
MRRHFYSLCVQIVIIAVMTFAACFFLAYSLDRYQFFSGTSKKDLAVIEPFFFGKNDSMNC